MIAGGRDLIVFGAVGGARAGFALIVTVLAVTLLGDRCARPARRPAGGPFAPAAGRARVTTEPRAVRVRAPTRIDLGGGWTDVPPYCDQEGGFVCNLAIDRYATATLHENGETAPEAIAARLPRSSVPRCSARGSAACRPRSRATFPSAPDSAGPRPPAPHCWARSPHGAASRGSSARSRKRGGASRSRNSALPEAGRITTRRRTAARSRCTFSRAGQGAPPRACLEHARRVRATGAAALHGRGAILRRKRDGSHARVRRTVRPRVVSALARMRTLAKEISVALEAGDLDAVGALVGEHWVHQRALHPAISTPLIDEIVRRSADHGALGAKALGASGGGCVLVIAAADERRAGARRRRAARHAPALPARFRWGVALRLTARNERWDLSSCLAAKQVAGQIHQRRWITQCSPISVPTPSMSPVSRAAAISHASSRMRASAITTRAARLS